MHRIGQSYQHGLHALITGMTWLSGVGMTGMMVLTCADVVARAFGRPIKGAYDGVCLLGLVTIVCALPYTTAVKGHVAVEFFFNKLPRLVRLVIDSLMRLLGIALFLVLTQQSLRYAGHLRTRGDVMLTLPIPLFWAPVIMAVAFLITTLVIIEHLVRPGKAVMRP